MVTQEKKNAFLKTLGQFLGNMLKVIHMHVKKSIAKIFVKF